MLSCIAIKAILMWTQRGMLLLDLLPVLLFAVLVFGLPLISRHRER